MYIHTQNESYTNVQHTCKRCVTCIYTVYKCTQICASMLYISIHQLYLRCTRIRGMLWDMCCFSFRDTKTHEQLDIISKVSTSTITGFRACQQHNGLDRSKLRSGLHTSPNSQISSYAPFCISRHRTLNRWYLATVQSLRNNGYPLEMFNDQRGKPSNKPHEHWERLESKPFVICPFNYGKSFGMVYGIGLTLNHSNKQNGCIQFHHPQPDNANVVAKQILLVKETGVSRTFPVWNRGQFSQNHRWICSRFGNPEKSGKLMLE